MNTSVLVITAVASLVTPLIPGAQGARTLGAPSATFPVEFSQIRGVRELRDGRVIVTDRLDEKVVVADFASGRLTTIGRVGQGPAEYHLPTSLLWMPGDSVLLIDEGNQRMAVIGPDLKIHRSFTLRVPGIGFPMGARALDTQGRYYLQIPGWISNARERGDSVWVVRFDARTNRVDTLALLKGSTTAVRDTRHPGFPMVAYAAQDAWTVTSDGRMAIVGTTDYRLDWRAPNGVITKGPSVPWTPIQVTAEDRKAFVRAFLANAPTSGKGPGGSMGATPAEFQTEAAVNSMVATNIFASSMGPVTDRAPVSAPDGHVWVERSRRTGDPVVWDVFGSDGKRMASVTFPRGRALVGVSGQWIYAVATDEDGVQRLERYK